MKSVSVLDKGFMLSENNKMIKDIFDNKNYEKAKEFTDNYVMPLLKEKNIDISNNENYMEQWKTISEYTMGFIKRWENGSIKKYLEQKYNFLNHQKIMPNMMRNNNKVFDIPNEDKIILSKIYAEFLYKIYTFEEKSNQYLKDYIIPILSKEDKIIFDLSSTDENVKMTTEKTIDLFLKYIHELGSMTFHNAIFEGLEKEEIEDMFNLYNFLYVDNLEIKELIANGLCNVFIENYDKIDFIQKTNVNIKYLYLFTPFEYED